MKFLIAAIVGAIIGYITNYLAIKMLFRPYEEIKIMGFKIPFTPGLIPKEKGRIAKSVAEAIGSHLLTKEVIVKTLLNSNMESHVKDFMLGKIEELKKKKISSLVGEEFMSYIYKFIDKNISLKEEVYDIIKNNEEALKKGSLKLREVLPPSLTNSIIVFIYSKKEDIAKSLEEKLLEEDTKDKIKEASHNAIMGKVSPMIGMFLNKDTVGDMVIDGLKSLLNSEKGKDEIINAALYYFNKALEGKAGTILEEIPQEGLETTIKVMSEKLTTEVEGELSKVKEKVLDLSIGEVLDENLEELLIKFILDIYRKIVENNAGSFIEALDISKIIEDNINSFDVKFAEEIIMEISRKELSAITWLGALLGGMIGVFSPFLGKL